MSPKSTNDSDRRIGGRIRRYRLAKGLSQTELAADLGITFQQLQKYEKGTNRIAASRLETLALLLGVPVAALYGTAHESATPEDADVARLTRAFAAIEDEGLRESTLSLLEALAKMKP